jgi:exopolyphosphatase/guanosine-5'-triphosphate,3'-diphosphate pyrophosphatase
VSRTGSRSTRAEASPVRSTVERRLAAIDLGTNTVRLLVVETDGAGGFTVIDEAQQITRLGQGRAATGRLAPGPMERTAAVVGEYATRAVRQGAARVLVVATSAVREAANGREFVARLERLVGQPIRVIPGQDEARLALLGVRRGLGPLRGIVAVLDIGGGSTELVRARDGRLEASVSLPVGVVALAEEGGSYADMARGVAGRLRRDLPAEFRSPRIEQLIGTAGTVTTMAALDLALPAWDSRRIHGHTLTRPAIERLRDRLLPLTVEEIANLPCLEPGRADVIRPGIAITLAVLDVLGLDRLCVSEAGLREGILAEALD